MTITQAEEVLADYLQDNKQSGLHSLDPYVFWENGDNTIVLDGTFTVEEITAIACLIQKNKQQ